MKESAGTLLYKEIEGKIYVLIVHPSGHKNDKWSIPKGNPNEGEELKEAAIRETYEETQVVAPTDLSYIGVETYRSGKKRVHCFAGKAPEDAKPFPTSWEVDKAEFVEASEATKMLHPQQAGFVVKLVSLVENH